MTTTLMSDYRRKLWIEITEGRITIEQLAATDDKTSALLPCGVVLIKAAEWARGEMRKRNAEAQMHTDNAKVVVTKRKRKPK